MYWLSHKAGREARSPWLDARKAFMGRVETVLEPGRRSDFSNCGQGRQLGAKGTRTGAITACCLLDRPTVPCGGSLSLHLG